MKRLGIRLAAAVLALTMVPAVTAQALDTGSGSATTQTMVTQADGELVPSQDAYLTGEVLFLDQPLTMPEDIFVQGQRLYVADSGAGRIVSTTLDGTDRRVLGEGILSYPTGVFVTDNGEIYVADSGLKEVVVLDGAGQVLRRYGRPESKTFGANAQYQPTKVAVNDSGILYIVSAGSFDGILQLDPSGEFLGYYGYNNVPMTALEVLQNLIFTEEQKAQLFNKIPLSFYNLALDDKGLCYTVTQKTDSAPLKKHNIAGVNILSGNLEAEDLADIAIGPQGQIFVVGESGTIMELDNNGQMLFAWGGTAQDSERGGIFTLPSGIAVDGDCCVYVLDKERGVVHTMVPTVYAQLMHEAITLYESGAYQQSLDTLLQLRQLAGDVQMIQEYMGKNQMQLRSYEAAMESYRRSGNSVGYSDAFWEVRTASMSRWFGVGFLALAVLVAAALLFSRRRKEKEVWMPSCYTGDRTPGYRRGLWSNLRFSAVVLRHPLDAFYEVKIGTRGSLLSATVLYVLAFAMFALYYVGRGFAFSQIQVADVSPLYVVMLFCLPVGLFVIASYMVSEINSGEGTFAKMYIGMAYALVPVICLAPVVTALTHVLTLSETFLVTLGTVAALGWTAILLLLSIREIHSYEPGQVAMNVVLALFLMIVMIFVGSIIGMFWDTVVDTVSAFGKEVFYRVSGQ